MQNRQIDGHGLYLSLLAGLAVLCLAAALVWFARPQPETAAPRYLLKDSGGHVALYTADGIGPLATYDDLYTRLLPESDVLALQQGVFVADEQGRALLARGRQRPPQTFRADRESAPTCRGRCSSSTRKRCGISSLLTFSCVCPAFML